MKIKRKIDQNLRLIIYVILIILGIIIGIHLLNNYYEKQESIKLENSINPTNKTSNNNTNSTTDETLKSNDNAENTLDIFINYCNNGEVESAYEMLTNECKNAMFKTVSDFKKIYVDNIFTEKKDVTGILWDKEDKMRTYQITFYSDALSSGIISNTIQDYYTFIEQEDGTYKLNINNYVYGENKNKTYYKDYITVKIGIVNYYRDYQEYEITVTNNTTSTISLTGNKYSQNLCLKNSSGITYPTLTSVFDTDELILNSNESKTYNVRFNKAYNSSIKVTSMIFRDVILNYETYKTATDKSNYTNRTSIEIKF